MKPLKVLYVTNMFPWEKNPYYGIFVKEQIEGIEKHFNIDWNLKFINGKKSTLNYFFSIIGINWHLLWNKYDIVHIHYGFSGLFLLFNPFHRTPTVLTLHSADIDPKKEKHVQIFFTKKIVKRIAYAIILNKEMESVLKPINENLISIPCGVNTDIFKPVPVASSADEDEKLIVFPANQERPEKNFTLFNQVVDILRSKYNWKIRTSEVKNMTRDQVCELFCEAACVLMTSYSEGSPQVIKEAMACNAPVVSTLVGDVDYLLEGVNNSHVVTSGTAEDLAQCVHEVILKNERSSSREQVFDLGLDEYGTSKKVYDLYLKVLGQ